MRKFIPLAWLMLTLVSWNAGAQECNPTVWKDPHLKIERLEAESKSLDRIADNLVEQAKSPGMTPSQKNEKMDQVIKTRTEALQLTLEAKKLREMLAECMQNAAKAKAQKAKSAGTTSQSSPKGNSGSAGAY